jgi:hypothetical protein
MERLGAVTRDLESVVTAIAATRNHSEIPAPGGVDLKAVDGLRLAHRLEIEQVDSRVEP